MSTYASSIRKHNLQLLIQKEAAGNVAGFCKAHGLDPGYVWQLLNDRRSFGEKAARKIENKLNCDIGFLDRTQIQEVSVQYTPNPDSPAKNDATPESVIFHTSALPQTTVIKVKSFAQILSKQQGTETMTVFGELPPSAFGYRLELDHMEGSPTYIQRGAMLVILPEVEPVDGDIVLANAGGAVIGKLSTFGGKYLIVPSRDKIPAIEASKDQIVGIVHSWNVVHSNPARNS